MTVRGLWLALALFGSAPVEAHCYSRWYYPWPQRCGAIRNNTRTGLHHVLFLDSHKAAFVSPGRGPSGPDLEIPLPSLARVDLDGGEADEAIRARVLLRAALEAANDH